LGDYYLFKKDYQKALECYENSKKFESLNPELLNKIEICKNELKNKDFSYYKIN